MYRTRRRLARAATRVCCTGRVQSSRMTKRFRLYWLRESGCDLGTPVAADQVDAVIRERGVELAGGAERTLDP